MNRPTKLELTDASGKTTALDFPAGEDVMKGFLRYEADATKQCIKAGKLYQIDGNVLIVTVGFPAILNTFLPALFIFGDLYTDKFPTTL